MPNRNLEALVQGPTTPTRSKIFPNENSTATSETCSCRGCPDVAWVGAVDVDGRTTSRKASPKPISTVAHVTTAPVEAHTNLAFSSGDVEDWKPWSGRCVAGGLPLVWSKLNNLNIYMNIFEETNFRTVKDYPQLDGGAHPCLWLSRFRTRASGRTPPSSPAYFRLANERLGKSDVQ